eukprot:6574760-Pyramimonas_sp.AAC.1
MEEQDGEQAEGQVDRRFRHAALEADCDGHARDGEGGEVHRARAEGPEAGRVEDDGGVQVEGRSVGTGKG